MSTAAPDLSTTEESGWSKYFDRIIPCFVIFYAVWTVLVHIATAIHASFNSLIHWLLWSVLLAGFLCWRWIRRQASQPIFAKSLPSAEHSFVPASRALAILVLASGWVAILAYAGHYTLFWWGAVIALGFVWVAGRSTDPLSFQRGHLDKRGILALLAVGLAACLVTLVANRPDADDAFYLSVPATLLRFPQQPVLLQDTIYRLPDLPIQLPVYRLHSYEVLIGVLARLSGINHAVIAYLWLPPLFALLSIVAWARLLRLLAPAHWSKILVILFICVLMLGEAHRDYGNFAFVRMFQGKAILVTCIVPCIFALALEYGHRPNINNWTILFAAQIAAIGITSTGLFVAPAAAWLGLVATWRPSSEATRRVLLGMLASVYVLAAAAILAVMTHAGAGVLTPSPMPSSLPWMDQVLGPRSTLILLATLLSAWSCTDNQAQSRWLLSTSLCFLLTVLNPYLRPLVAHYVTGVSTYWRLFWAIPLPFMLAIMLHFAWMQAKLWQSRRLIATACATALITMCLFAWQENSLRRENQVQLGIPGLKVPGAEYSIAQRVATLVQENDVLLAPESITTLLAGFTLHPELLSVRSIYTVNAFGSEDGRRRLALQQYVTGVQRLPDGPDALASAITSYQLTAIVVARSAAWSQEISTTLQARNWQRTDLGSYDLWIAPNHRVGDKTPPKNLTSKPATLVCVLETPAAGMA